MIQYSSFGLWGSGKPLLHSLFLQASGRVGGHKTRRRWECPPDKHRRAEAADTRRAGDRSVRQTNIGGPRRRTQDAPGTEASARRLPRAHLSWRPRGQKVVLADTKRVGKANVRQKCLYLGFCDGKSEVKGGQTSEKDGVCPPKSV